MKYNRTTRRMYANSHDLKIEALQPINMGNCHFCKQPVWAAENQVVKLFKEKLISRVDGKVISETSSPTHKKCRKP